MYARFEKKKTGMSFVQRLKVKEIRNDSKNVERL